MNDPLTDFRSTMRKPLFVIMMILGALGGSMMFEHPRSGFALLAVACGICLWGMKQR